MDISEVPEVGEVMRELLEFLYKGGEEDVGDSDLTTTIARLATAQLAMKAKATKSIWKVTREKAMQWLVSAISSVCTQSQDW